MEYTCGLGTSPLHTTENIVMLVCLYMGDEIGVETILAQGEHLHTEQRWETNPQP